MSVIDKQIKDALGRVLLGFGLQVATADLSKLEQAVSDAALQTIAKETGGAKSGYDLPRALDRFGQSGGASAPEQGIIAPEEYLGETGEPGETKKTPRAARETYGEEAAVEKPFEPFSEQTPAEQAAGPEGEKPRGAGQEGEGAGEAEEGEGVPSIAGQAAQAGRPDITGGRRKEQNLVQELEKSNKQLNDLSNQEKISAKKEDQLKRKLRPFEIQKRLLKQTITTLRIIKWILWSLGVLLSWCGVGEFLAGAAIYIGRAIRVLRRRLTQLEQTTKPLENDLRKEEENREKKREPIREIGKRALVLRRQLAGVRQANAARTS